MSTHAIDSFFENLCLDGCGMTLTELLERSPSRKPLPGEAKAIAAAKKAAADNPQLAFCLIIKKLGATLIEAAAPRLPAECTELTQNFRASSIMDGRYEALFSADELFQRLAEEAPKRPASGLGGAFDDYICQPPEGFLPYQFATVDPEARINCLGQTLVLAAFATTLGAQYMTCMPTRSFSSVMSEQILEAQLEVYDAFHEAGLLSDANLLSRQQSVAFFEATRDLQQTLVHHCIIVKIHPKIWCMVDPFGGVFGGPLTQETIIETAGLLNHDDELAYSSAVMMETGPACELKLKGIMAKFLLRTDDLIEVVRTLKQQLEAARSNGSWDLEQVLDIYLKSDAFKGGLDYFKVAGKVIPEINHREYALSHMMDPKSDDRERFASDGEFAEQCIERMFMYYQQTAFYALQKSLCRSARIFPHLIHPACEFMNPELGLGLAVVSDYAIAMGYPDEVLRILGSLFPTQQCQTLELLGDSSAGSHAILDTPWLHPAIVKILTSRGYQPRGTYVQT